MFNNNFNNKKTQHKTISSPNRFSSLSNRAESPNNYNNVKNQNENTNKLNIPKKTFTDINSTRKKDIKQNFSTSNKLLKSYYNTRNISNIDNNPKNKNLSSSKNNFTERPKSSDFNFLNNILNDPLSENSQNLNVPNNFSNKNTIEEKENLYTNNNNMNFSNNFFTNNNNNNKNQNLTLFFESPLSKAKLNQEINNNLNNNQKANNQNDTKNELIQLISFLNNSTEYKPTLSSSTGFANLLTQNNINNLNINTNINTIPNTYNNANSITNLNTIENIVLNTNNNQKILNNLNSNVLEYKNTNKYINVDGSGCHNKFTFSETFNNEENKKFLLNNKPKPNNILKNNFINEYLKKNHIKSSSFSDYNSNFLNNNFNNLIKNNNLQNTKKIIYPVGSNYNYSNNNNNININQPIQQEKINLNNSKSLEFNEKYSSDIINLQELIQLKEKTNSKNDIYKNNFYNNNENNYQNSKINYIGDNKRKENDIRSLNFEADKNNNENKESLSDVIMRNKYKNLLDKFDKTKPI